jgi:DNA-binding transcriptional MocR family regulator
MVQFASRMNELKGSEIRELLKLTARPDIISFAGGLPAPELFPVEEMKALTGGDGFDDIFVYIEQFLVKNGLM